MQIHLLRNKIFEIKTMFNDEFEKLMKEIVVDPADPSRVVGDVLWYNKGITVLPESIGDLAIGERLMLTSNRLTSLPEGFGSLTVKGDLEQLRRHVRRLPSWSSKGRRSPSSATSALETNSSRQTPSSAWIVKLEALPPSLPPFPSVAFLASRSKCLALLDAVVVASHCSRG